MQTGRPSLSAICELLLSLSVCLSLSFLVAHTRPSLNQIVLLLWKPQWNVRANIVIVSSTVNHNTPHRREDLTQPPPPHQGERHLCLAFRQLGKKLRKAYMSFRLSPRRLSRSWLPGYYGMALNATVGGRGRSWPICYQVRGVSQGASNKLSAVTQVSKHGNFIERSKVIWNKPVPLENRRGDQMILKVERMLESERTV